MRRVHVVAVEADGGLPKGEVVDVVGGEGHVITVVVTGKRVSVVSGMMPS